VNGSSLMVCDCVLCQLPLRFFSEGLVSYGALSCSQGSCIPLLSQNIVLIGYGYSMLFLAESLRNSGSCLDLKTATKFYSPETLLNVFP
jgi:hypothetical protein